MRNYLKLFLIAAFVLLASGCIKSVQHYAGAPRPVAETATINLFKLNIRSINGEAFTAKNAMSYNIEVAPGDYTVVASTRWDTVVGSTATHRESAPLSVSLTAKPGMIYALRPKEGSFYTLLGIDVIEVAK